MLLRIRFNLVPKNVSCRVLLADKQAVFLGKPHTVFSHICQGLAEQYYLFVVTN